MTLEALLILIVAANVLPLTGISSTNANVLLTLISISLGCEAELTIQVVDGTIFYYGDISTSFEVVTNDGIVCVDSATQVKFVNRFVWIDRATETVRLYIDFKHIDPNNVAVLIDDRLALWDSVQRCFIADISDNTPRISNVSSQTRLFDAVIRVDTQGCSLQHLKHL